jgi:TatD DNase family protein
MLETDSPFMTPEPYRGKRNEPANVKLVAEKLAEIHHLTVEDVARLTSYNVFRMFGIGSKQTSINYTYKIGKSLYINVTNRCNAKCQFCDREGEAVINGYNLRMPKGEEPDALVYIKEIGDPKQYKEVIFCGYGEPTIRWDVVKKVAKYVKEMGGRTRINTNGHGNIINRRDILPEFKGIIDTVSVSINSPDARQYSELMGLDVSYYNEMINFSKEAKNYVERVVLTAVAMDEINLEKTRKIVEEKIGAEFRVRQYF